VHIGFCWESWKERDHYKDLDVGGKIILEWKVGTTSPTSGGRSVGIVRSLTKATEFSFG
jgi:hypothetical protein